jgi:hypothetical protein
MLQQNTEIPSAHLQGVENDSHAESVNEVREPHSTAQESATQFVVTKETIPYATVMMSNHFLGCSTQSCEQCAE